MPTKKPPELKPKAHQPKPLHLRAKEVTASQQKLRSEARRQAVMSREPLKQQHSSTAWYERQARLSAGRESAKLHLMASYKRKPGDPREELKPGWRK